MRAAVAVAALLGSPALASAYSDATRFTEPATDGGGGGRYFTGAPPDGLSCQVCHDDAAAPAVDVRGLPDHLEVGASYDLTLTWPADDRLYAMALELVDGNGQHPSTTLPALADQPTEMLCAGDRTGASAAQAIDLGGRRVIFVEPCGAHQLTVSFTAASDEDLFLGAAVVASDGFETADGDGTFELRRTLTTSTISTTGCATGGPGSAGLTVVVAALALRRRRRA